MVRQIHRPGNTELCRLQRNSLFFGGHRGALIDRRDSAVHASRGLLPSIQHHLWIKLREKHQKTLLLNPKSQVQRHPKGMEHGQDRVEDFLAFLGALHPGFTLQCVGIQVVMGEHRTLRMTGSARGVLNDRQVGDLRHRMFGVQTFGG